MAEITLTIPDNIKSRTGKKILCDKDGAYMFHTMVAFSLQLEYFLDDFNRQGFLRQDAKHVCVNALNGVKKLNLFFENIFNQSGEDLFDQHNEYSAIWGTFLRNLIEADPSKREKLIELLLHFNEGKIYEVQDDQNEQYIKPFVKEFNVGS